MANDMNGEEKSSLPEDPKLDEAPKAEASAEAEKKADASASEALLEEWKSRAAYLAAEIDNMRKRFVRDRADIIKNANEDLLKGILPVYDNLFLALRSIREALEKKEQTEGVAPAEKLFENLLKGVEMTFQHFETTLDRIGVKVVDAVGKEFDPTLHEAVGQSSDTNFKDNTVTAEFQRGFLLHGRPLRPARVVVNKVSES